MVYGVKVDSKFGTMLETYRKYCREHIGEEEYDWVYESYRWHYIFTFERESDAMMFQLKWKNV